MGTDYALRIAEEGRRLMRRFSEDMGERLGQSMRTEVSAKSTESLRKLAVDSKPPSKKPHSFDADARHDFET